MPNEAIVLLSGGQDSTTCLFWALARYQKVRAVSFNYGQRHLLELNRAAEIAEYAQVPHMILHLDVLRQLGGNALTEPDKLIEHLPNLLPNTFVPGRNILFLAAAAAYAYPLGVPNLVTGVCQTDYSGYPDCRLETIQAMEQALRLGMEWPALTIQTPLMNLTKADTVRLMRSFGDFAWSVLGMTHTCYQGTHRPCGECPACLLRAKGFEEAGYQDPLLSTGGVPWEKN